MQARTTRAERARLRAQAQAALVPPSQLLQRQQRAKINASLEHAPGSRWIVLEVRSGRDYYIAEKITRRPGFAVYFPERPIYKGKPRGESGKRREYFINAAAGYIFVGVPGALSAAFNLQREPDVLGILGREGRPAIMSEPQIGRMARAAGDRGLSKHTAPRERPEISPGTRATIVGGPLNGRSITVKSLSGSRAKFISKWFGSEIETLIDLDRLEIE